MPNYDREKWYDLYRTALMEFEHSLVAGRIKDARGEILKRVEELQGIPGLHTEEKQAIEDALHGLRSLERTERAELEHIAREARAALEKLRSLQPKLERLKLDPNEE